MLGENELRLDDGALTARVVDSDRVDLDLVAIVESDDANRAHANAEGRAHAAREPWPAVVGDALQMLRAEHRSDARRVYEGTKRMVDLLLAPFLMLVSLPVMFLLALLVRLDSRGAVIFRQTRVGRHGRYFTFYKFRTMYADARDRFPDLYAYDYSREQAETMYFKLADDPRCTRVGRLLRRTSLDELPNLLNVLKGDMSLVGPRPEIPEMLRHYRPDQLAKFTVTPGLTGLAQISGRNLLTFQDTTRHDLEYVRRRSLWFDLFILVRTPVVVIQMIGAL